VFKTLKKNFSVCFYGIVLIQFSNWQTFRSQAKSKDSALAHQLIILDAAIWPDCCQLLVF